MWFECVHVYVCDMYWYVYSFAWWGLCGCVVFRLFVNMCIYNVLHLILPGLTWPTLCSYPYYSVQPLLFACQEATNHRIPMQCYTWYTRKFHLTCLNPFLWLQCISSFWISITNCLHDHSSLPAELLMDPVSPLDSYNSSLWKSIFTFFCLH